jgi:hypothetical protein
VAAVQRQRRIAIGAGGGGANIVGRREREKGAEKVGIGWKKRGTSEIYE